MSTYPLAQERFAQWGVDTENALNTLATTPVSLHCWQGDDVGGFEGLGGTFGCEGRSNSVTRGGRIM